MTMILLKDVVRVRGASLVERVNGRPARANRRQWLVRPPWFDRRWSPFVTRQRRRHGRRIHRRDVRSL